MTREEKEVYIVEYFDNKENIHRARMVNRFSRMFDCLKDKARSGDLETDLVELADKSIDTLYDECVESLSDPDFKVIDSWSLKEEDREEFIEITDEEFNNLDKGIL